MDTRRNFVRGEPTIGEKDLHMEAFSSGWRLAPTFAPPPPPSP